MARRAADILSEAQQIASLWAGRHQMMAKWYDLIRLRNDLAQPNMESVIAADPRTGFNMARWLLTPKTPVFNVDVSALTEAQAREVGPIERYCDQRLADVQKRTRTHPHGQFLSRLVAQMVATGWYSVISFPLDEGWVMGAWNPAGVFPDYAGDDSGSLLRLARIYTCSGYEANRKIEREGWLKPSRPFGRTNHRVTVLWKVASDSTVSLEVVIGNHLALPETLYDLDRIPVFVGPVAGLPDDGTLMGELWRSEIGQSVVAPIMDVQKNFDKMLTYVQQLVRDTANPRIVEHVRGQRRVVTEATWYSRGAFYSLEPDESIEVLAPPLLPPELRTHLFDLRGQTQRGLFSDITFGNLQQRISALLMSQVTAAAQQVLSPFADGIKALLSDIATTNIHWMRAWRLPIPGATPLSLPDDLDIEFKYDIEIPGDFIQRASIAKILNPDFKLSEATLMDIMFPEVQNAMLEKGRIRSEDAQRSPVFRQVVLLQNLRLAAAEARDSGDAVFAQLLDRAAAQAEAMTFEGAEPGTSPGFNPPPSAMPTEVQELMTGGGP